MNAALISLHAASIAFVGGHFALSHPLRAPLVKALGEKGFLGLYSLISLASFGWMIWAFRAVGPGGDTYWNATGNLGWAIASVLTVIALVLLLGSLKGNPALPETSAAAVSTAKAKGVFAVTRHPMMWGFALWAAAHILIMPTPRTIVLAGSLLILALLGAHLQDRKKEALLGVAWARWEAKTSYWPRLGKLAGAGWGLWLGAIIAWLAITFAHIWLADVPAGIWRWLG
jgi:uncharacterized membrane protein